jgi:peptidoglycan/LPS O-acetylase OafA/YrhL
MNQIGFGLDKALIALGIKSNSLVDYIFGLFALLTLLAGATLLQTKELRPWGSATLATIGILSLQAAVFQADRRFVIPVLYPFSVICIGLALNLFASKIPGNMRILKFKRALRIGRSSTSAEA